MKRRIMALALTVIMMFTAFGCSNKDSREPEPTAAPTQAAEPTKEPTAAPTPTTEPTAVPTEEPTPEPTAEPVPTTALVDGTPVNIEVYIGTETEFAWDETEMESYGDYIYQYPYMTEEDEARYPGLAAAFKAIADAREADKDDYVSLLTHTKEEMELYGEYSIKREMTAIRADSSIVCLRDRYEYFTSDWTVGCSGTCFDPATGEKIGLAEIVKDRDAFIDRLYEATANQAVSLADPDNLKNYIIERFDTNTLNFEIGYNYLGVIYNPYEIETHPAFMVVSIPFKSNENLFEERYMNAAENYSIDMGGYMMFRDDLGNDGVVDEFQIWCNYDEEEEEQGFGDFDSIAVYINGYSEIVLFPGYSCYGADAMFVHADGQNYLYVRYTFDSEDTITKVYRIYTTAEGFKPETWENPYADVIETGEIWDIYRNCSYDPKNIVLEARVDIIGTSFVKNRFTIIEDGMMQVKDDVYDFLYSWSELTAKTDIAMKLVDRNTGAEIGDYTAKAGEKFRLLQTNLTEYIDLLSSSDDQVLYRLPITVETVDYGDWSFERYKPEGAEDFEDLFEGIAYYD